MAKECLACGKAINIWSTIGTKVADGYVHISCWRKAGLGFDYSYSRLYTGAAVKERLAARSGIQKLTDNNHGIRHIGLFSFNDSTQTFTIIKKKENKEIYRYNQIVDFELLENGETVTKGGLGRAVVGGMLFGGVGAVVGGVTGSRRAKGVCRSLKIKITFRNSPNLTEYIDFIDTETMTDSSFYQIRYEDAQETLSALQLAVKQVEDSVGAEPSTEQVASSADEILKFKQLLDMGAITQEEFEAKKKQLLGL